MAVTDEATQAELSRTLSHLELALAEKTELTNTALYQIGARKKDSQARITKIVSALKQFADDLGHKMERELEEVILN